MVEYWTDENGNEIRIEFDEIVQELDVIDCYDRDVEVLGYDEDGNEYSAVGMESCDELVEIDVDSIEPNVEYNEARYLESLVDNNPDDGSWVGR